MTIRTRGMCFVYLAFRFGGIGKRAEGEQQNKRYYAQGRDTDGTVFFFIYFLFNFHRSSKTHIIIIAGTFFSNRELLHNNSTEGSFFEPKYIM